jgi:EAL domain-containing protein (putative c-di-GMP-specific phosphodiesterase class I)
MREVARRWVQQFSSGKTIARFVNVSADLLRHPELVDDVLNTVMDNVGNGNDRRDNKPLVIEITEWEFLNNPRELRQILAPFLDYGMRLAIDDFGSGYSSFQYLTDLPVTYLKIDGTLVRRASKESRVRAILKGIRDIAGDLGLTTMAEWVEDEATSELLREIGIHWAQGYYFGRPQLHAGKDNILGIR